MSIPVIETIAAEVLDRINEITVANGFNQTLVAVRPKRLLFFTDTWDDLTVIVAQGDESDRAIGVGGYGVSDIGQMFDIMVVVIDSDTTDATIDTRINQVAADIIKKLKDDITRGGSAYDTIVLPAERFSWSDSFSGITVKVEVRYRTREDDPYTQA